MTAWPTRKWLIVIGAVLLGVLSVAVASYEAFTEVENLFADRAAVCPLIPEAQQDCVKFLVALRGKINSQGRPCKLIRKVSLKHDAMTSKTGFDVTCLSVDSKTSYRYEVEDRTDLPIVKVIP